MQRIAMSAESVTASIGRTPVLVGVNASFREGRWTSIVGPNGAGKSTLLKVLAGLLPYAGKVSFLGKPLSEWPRRERAQSLAWLGQNETAAEDLGVYDVAMLGRIPHQGWLASPSAADHAAVERVLRVTQAWDFRARSLGALSGGERQRVLLARALVSEAQVLLMDEPLANLDPPHQADWLVIVRALVANGTTVVSVLHEISMALNADELVIMAAGRVTYEGSCRDSATHGALEAVFDHRLAVLSVADQWIAIPR
jgi:iron complex transport system ATP-binding protein